jgi:hypothetical protein
MVRRIAAICNNAIISRLLNVLKEETGLSGLVSTKGKWQEVFAFVKQSVPMQI